MSRVEVGQDRILTAPQASCDSFRMSGIFPSAHGEPFDLAQESLVEPSGCAALSQTV